ncbi:hypothetical protein A2841_00435 [Candidatus Kaiserbacteria bacterium RIFCSPHIGHO2_01_FULL_48_10]|uniref:Uncharacterized protein n=1 Tax=Candidatus Kaiserbacteria bacterium RIFCSPHIGHO2_01_FULL_48_10 TaxID=1798476 RepID=A0A1F6C5J3_9BACT|nr:MAG: hypothetical protein A2841_00435 [Candidatus Kaiserbacteria bacterium RIFCSPHIGHO2_01_FULL_48_10]
MELEEAKKQLRKFFGGKVLTFSIKEFNSSEWVAECNEIPAIITGGTGNNITERDALIRDAIVVAAGIGSGFQNLLVFEGYKVPNGIFPFNALTKAEYALR